MDDVDERGEPIMDDTLLVLLNTGAETASFVLPDAHPGDRWEMLVDTAATPTPEKCSLAIGALQPLAGRSLQFLRACRHG